MDTALEDKICDLYDLYVDGLDEDAGPQIRKLYVELAHLWPNGLMDNHGIKRAICRAKERRREMYNRHRPQYTREGLGSDSGGHGLAASGKPNSNTTAASMRTPSPSASGDRLKQEKLKGSSSNSMDEVKTADGMMTSIKKKVKRKAELDLDGTPVHPEKLPVQQSDERHKSQKLSAGLPQKTNLQSTAPNFEQSS
ncbi:ubinuclein-2-like isoform X2 [Mangifera indica]|nr:ubinuclein-2-like isoform X2 [Mangifera indica]